MPPVELLRGDCVRLPSPRGTRGREQRGRRMAVVVQADELAGLSTVVVAPTSTSARPATFRPVVEIDGRATRILVEQLAAVDPSRLGPVVDRLDGAELADLDRALAVVVGL